MHVHRRIQSLKLFHPAVYPIAPASSQLPEHDDATYLPAFFFHPLPSGNHNNSLFYSPDSFHCLFLNLPMHSSLFTDRYIILSQFLTHKPRSGFFSQNEFSPVLSAFCRQIILSYPYPQDMGSRIGTFFKPKRLTKTVSYRLHQPFSYTCLYISSLTSPDAGDRFSFYKFRTDIQFFHTFILLFHHSQKPVHRSFPHFFEISTNSSQFRR